MCCPHPSVTGYNGVFSTNGTGSTIVARNDVYSIAPSMTKIWGSHTLKFGAEIRRSTHNYYQQNNPSGTLQLRCADDRRQPVRRRRHRAMALHHSCSDMATAAGSPRTHFVAGADASIARYYAGDQWQISSNAHVELRLALRADGSLVGAL